MNRIEGHPALGEDDREVVEFVVDGRTVSARAGETVATALWADGQRVLRRSRRGMPRGMYCGIGHCWECRMIVVGDEGSESEVRTCLTPVEPGLRVRTSSVHAAPERELNTE
ncbi:(2Fe-2S)-binding protein [Brevibacterium casei]|uniref:(2Fe-2S)-binding protein n=1 Tax=Brevibacterium casei TaxID=33889 RepID=A0A7T2WLZ2_9MICO|nr:(2Fe-2S)-binding protein [Brevibacterium casei]QPR39967.1 (2Fe-2S)-binding protein [Brevibacterium casei]QPR44131.1 (2Fe-2S)-binding protein [Brevibacterium casei]QPS32335.1 (2Fe-2S)-binding protein [Brevibacterium casei]